MKLKIYQVDAFTDRVFSGNPAAVIPLGSWLDDDVLQAIASENNLSETAFFVPVNGAYHLRWFTPKTEVPLCGYATLASAYVLFNILNYDKSDIKFETKSGSLFVTRMEEKLKVDFPAQEPQKCDMPEGLADALGSVPVEIWKHDDLIALYKREQEIRELEPDFGKLAKLDTRGVIITAPGDNVDFVSRFFAPNYGIDEDPVTGAAHCQLTPYWAQRLGKNNLAAKQVSRREGELLCELHKDRVALIGNAIKYLEGEIEFYL